MARGSFWDELGRDRERRRRAEMARLRAEAQIRKDERRAAARAQRETAAESRARGAAEAAERQAELDARMAELTGVLRAVVAFPVPTVDELRGSPPEVEPEPGDEQPPRWSDYAPPEPGLFGHLGHRRAEAGARARFDEAYAAFAGRRAEAAARHDARVARARAEHERRIDGLVAAAHRGDQDAVPELAAAVLAAVVPLRDLVRGGDGVYRPDARELAVDVRLPDRDVIPAERRWKYVGTRRVVEAEPRRDAPACYVDLVGQLVLAVVATCFRAFPPQVVDTVTVNGYVVDTDPSTGRPARPCVVTVNAARSTFDGLQLDSPKLQALRCLHRLEAEISPNPYALEPVTPLVDVDVFKRYRLAAPEELAALDHRTDLMRMSPRDFEILVVELFAAMGYRSWPTRYSHDDGIDGVVVSDDPHLPVECLVQVKRTRSCIPPTMVQALMGALAENPSATHGYFVTTSWFSAQTRRRARDRRVRTMEGPQLRQHIAEHLGRDVVISVSPPARRR
jgi:restriction system protein